MDVDISKATPSGGEFYTLLEDTGCLPMAKKTTSPPLRIPEGTVKQTKTVREAWVSRYVRVKLP